MKKPTTKSLSLRRLKLLAGAILVGVVAPELIDGGAFDWAIVLAGSQVAFGYWLLTTFRDWYDPEMPNK